MAAGKSGEDCVTIGAAGPEESSNVAVGIRNFPWRDETTALNLTRRCLRPVEHRTVGRQADAVRVWTFRDHPRDRASVGCRVVERTLMDVIGEIEAPRLIEDEVIGGAEGNAITVAIQDLGRARGQVDALDAGFDPILCANSETCSTGRRRFAMQPRSRSNAFVGQSC